MFVLLITIFFSPAPVDETALVRQLATLTVHWENGAASIRKVERQALTSPSRFPRWRGRFEARALGPDDKKAEFVRFDFPLMAEAEPPDEVTAEAHALGKRLRDHVTATTIVKLPLPPNATQVAIWDSFTKKQVVAPLPSVAAPAGDAAGSTRR